MKKEYSVPTVDISSLKLSVRIAAGEDDDINYGENYISDNW